MENIENLKKTNKALIVGNVVLGCLLIVIMALFALVAIKTAPISASAEENYLLEEITITQEDDGGEAIGAYIKTSTPIIQGLTAGQRLKITYELDGIEGAVTGYLLEADGQQMIANSPNLVDGQEMYININEHISLVIQPYLNILTNESGSTWCIIKNENLSTFTITFKTITIEEEPIGPINSSEIIENITSSFTSFLTGTGEGIINLFEEILLTEEGNLSILAIVGLSMIGLGIAIGTIKYLLARAG